MKLATEGLAIVHDPMDVANDDDGDEDAEKDSKKKKKKGKAKGKPKKSTLAMSPSTKQAVIGTASRQVASPAKAKLDVHAPGVFVCFVFFLSVCSRYQNTRVTIQRRRGRLRRR